MGPYAPPPVPLNVEKQRARNLCLAFVLFFLAHAGGFIWLYYIYFYAFNLFTKSPLNRIRHESSYVIFAAFGLVFMIFLISLSVTMARRCLRFLLCVCYTIFLIFTVVYIMKTRGQYRCETMDRFPVYMEMNVLPFGYGVSGDVYLHKQKTWQMTHTGNKQNGTYHTYLSHDILVRDPWRNGWISHDTTWPKNTAVDHIWTTLRPSDDADGTIRGTCRGTPCLEGKLWMKPNLVFQWTYRNPLTGEEKTTTLASDDGRWFFGDVFRPLVSLKNNGTEVFRAQCTNVVCSGGNGELETSLVPMGLMMVAETRYKRDKSHDIMD